MKLPVIVKRFILPNQDGIKTRKALVHFDGEMYHVSDNGEETYVFYAAETKEGFRCAVAGTKNFDLRTGVSTGINIEYVLNNFEKFITKYKFG